MTTTAAKPPHPDDRRESELLRRIAQRDKGAIEELYRLYHARLFKFIFRLTHSYAASDELVNDIMLIVWQGASSFRGDARVSTWIFGIAYRQAMRRLSRRPGLPDGTPPDELGHDDMGKVETEDWVWRGLRTLPAEQQVTVVLVFYLGLSYAETAEVTGCPVNTVKTRMFHARRKLRACLAESAQAQPPGDNRRHG